MSPVTDETSQMRRHKIVVSLAFPNSVAETTKVLHTEDDLELFTKMSFTETTMARISLPFVHTPRRAI